jgi:hypothetical protein
VKRLAFKLLLFLLAGAIIDVAVAWGSALWSTNSYGTKGFQTRVLQLDDLHRFDPDAMQLLGSSSRIAAVGSLPSSRCAVLEQIFAVNIDRHSFVSITMDVGWPCHGLAGESWEISYGSNSLGVRHSNFITVCKRRFPVRPLWPGFAINTIFYAAILWMMFALPIAVRRRRRIKRGLCAACGYPIGSRPTCSECGAAISLRL